MRYWSVTVCAALLAACAPKDEGVITVARLSDGGYRLTLETPALKDAAQGQQLLLPAALQLCGKKGMAFGAHVLKKQDTPPRLIQDLRCEAPAAGRSAPTTFVATAADEQAVTALSEQFLRARDAGDLDTARQMFAADWPQAEQKTWAAEVAAFRRLAGAGTKQAISRINWFENPPAAPAPGIYAAVDYGRTFETVKTACGFIVWRRQADGGWRIDRERLSYLSPDEEARVKRADLPEIRARLGCR